MKYKDFNVKVRIPQPQLRVNRNNIARWLPSRGNVLFTLLVMGGLLWASRAGALPLGAPAAATASTGTVPYQGRLADAAGAPLTGTFPMIFRLYTAATGGTPQWTEQWTGSNSVRVSDGLFNVMLGSLTAIPQTVVTRNSSLWLGITVGTDDEMAPRVQLGSVPFAVQALTVPDRSITTAKLADGSVTAAKLAPNLQTNVQRGFTPLVVSDGVSPEMHESLHRWTSSGESRVIISFKVPDDYVSGDLTVLAALTVHDTAAGTIAKISRTINRYRKSDGASTTISSAAADHDFGTSIRTFSIPSGSFEAGDLIWIREIRDGDNPADTAGRLDLKAIGAAYTGK